MLLLVLIMEKHEDRFCNFTLLLVVGYIGLANISPQCPFCCLLAMALMKTSFTSCGIFIDMPAHFCQLLKSFAICVQVIARLRSFLKHPHRHHLATAGDCTSLKPFGLLKRKRTASIQGKSFFQELKLRVNTFSFSHLSTRLRFSFIHVPIEVLIFTASQL